MMQLQCSSNAVHNALFCHEILVEILAYLSPGWFPWLRSDRDSDSRKSEIREDIKTRRALQRTLASCARTCQAFSEPALAELWRVLDHYILLLRFLPWRRSRNGVFDGMIELEPEIDDRAWSRFRWYARLVCEMNGSVYPDDIGVHRNTWTLLASRLQGEPFLPCLRRLQMPVDVLKDTMPFLFSLSPTVRVLTFEFDHPWYSTRVLGYGLSVSDDTEFLHTFLHLISGSAGDPLNASMCRLLEGDTEEVMQHLRSCARLDVLQRLDLRKARYTIDRSAVSALSRLGSLHTLRIGLSAQDPPTTPLFTGFASLRNLSLGYLPITVLSEILTTGSLRASSLRSIEFDTSTKARNHAIPISEFQHHLSSIRATLPDELESVRLKLTYHSNTGPPPPLSDLFAPFLSLGSLKLFEVFFRSKCVLRVADEDLRALASAWPDLEVLYIRTWDSMRPPRGFSTTRPPTVATLAEFARGCPRLHKVTFPGLDVAALAEEDGAPHSHFEVEAHQGVRFLDVGALVGDNGLSAQDVASVLDRLFPCHEEYSRVGGEHHRTKSWFAVQDAMREIRAARIAITV
ncbi:hypothetical protein LXA43DRAFT_645500 [Ganoderma leucocontextum]|nr:hypothetical protein LXA43DRAFT_645500 [Ganoderma leucocontextum]